MTLGCNVILGAIWKLTRETKAREREKEKEGKSVIFGVYTRHFRVSKLGCRTQKTQNYITPERNKFLKVGHQLFSPHVDLVTEIFYIWKM